jgi:hydroxymethylpyrimidine pyrophosphatase-like HAD family hydrolase
MSAKQIKLLLADVDGTLVTQDKVLTEQAIAAAHELHSAGVTLALTSGRPPRGMSMLYTETDWLIRDPKAPHVARETWTVKFDAKVVKEFTDEQLKDAVKIVGVSDDLDKVAACEKSAQQKLGDRASAARSQPYYLDVTSPQANKGGVVMMLAKLNKIQPDEIATIGDMPNDVLMFRKSGLSIAMGNSSDEVKSQASEVTDSNQDEGFAKAVRKFILKAAT